MSTHQSKTWLVAYDICHPRRLRRVHRLLRKEGLAAQYSAFTVEADDAAIVTLLHALKTEINIGEDDVRAYHLPASCPIWRLGAQQWPDGACLTPPQAVRLLMETAQLARADATNRITEEAISPSA